MQDMDIDIGMKGSLSLISADAFLMQIDAFLSNKISF